MLKNCLLMEVLYQKHLETTSHMWDSRRGLSLSFSKADTLEGIYKEID